MDLEEYQDERESTESCFKLECGHAFHTKCIVMVLTQSNHECPSCNKYKTPETQLDLEGKCRKLIYEVLKDPEIRELKNEFDEAKECYKECIKNIKAEVSEFIKEKVKEHKFHENRDYYNKCKNKVVTEVKKGCSEKGNKYLAAFFSQGNNRFGIAFGERILFGLYRRMSSRYCSEYWRLKHPRIRADLANLPKDKDD
jgi:hypothetical protein